VWLETFVQVDLRRLLSGDGVVNLHEIVIHVLHLMIVPAWVADVAAAAAAVAADDDDHGIDDPSRNHPLDLQPVADIYSTYPPLCPSCWSPIFHFHVYGELPMGTAIHYDRHLGYHRDVVSEAVVNGRCRVKVDRLAYVLLMSPLDFGEVVEKDFEALYALECSPYDLFQYNKDLPSSNFLLLLVVAAVVVCVFGYS
jgi:hypothetical protein